LVLSKSAKHEAKKKEKLKHVHFAKPIVQPPLVIKHQPTITLTFGFFTNHVDLSKLVRRSVFGSPESFDHCQSHGHNGEPKNKAPSSA
jgi:hypothetical protein